MKHELMYLNIFSENIVHDGDFYLFKILMVAGKKVIASKWGTEDLPTHPLAGHSGGNTCDGKIGPQATDDRITNGQ